MTRTRILQTVCTLASLLMLTASCSDEMDSDTGSRLPEGKYPMTFTAAVDGLTATRATTDGTWTGSEEIAIKIGSEVKKYKAASGGNLTIADDNTPFYWQTSSETKRVSAWYLGTEYSGTQPITWSVQLDQSKTETQSTSDNYQRSDFLYAPQTGISYGSNEKKLTFYHQTAKVVINIRNAEMVTDNAGQIQSVGIYSVTPGGTFSAPASGGTYGLTASGSQASIITPRKQATANSNVNFGSGNETALVSYEALVIPQTVTANSNFIGITLTGVGTYYYKAVNGLNQLKAGNVHTYNITVKGQELVVTTPTSSSPQWTGSEEKVNEITTTDKTN